MRLTSEYSDPRLTRRKVRLQQISKNTLFSMTPPITVTDASTLDPRASVFRPITTNADLATFCENRYGYGYGAQFASFLDDNTVEAARSRALSTIEATAKRTEKLEKTVNSIKARAEERYDATMTALTEATEDGKIHQDEATEDIITHQEGTKDEILEQGERHHEEIINRLEILAKQGDLEAIQELEQRNAELERDNKRAAKEHHAREVKWNSMNQKKDERIQTLEAQLDKNAPDLGRKHLRERRARALAEASVNLPTSKREVIAVAVHHGRRTETAKTHANETRVRKSTFFSTKP